MVEAKNIEGSLLGCMVKQEAAGTAANVYKKYRTSFFILLIELMYRNRRYSDYIQEKRERQGYISYEQQRAALIKIEMVYMSFMETT